MRLCGRHQCNRVCCPLAGFGIGGNQGGKGKKRRLGMDLDAELAELGELSGLHECDLVCGKPLACGRHSCEAPDHKGPCRPCLRSSFEEMICHCTRTILDPPIPCGTKMRCPFPCARPPPPCGHPAVPHACHGLLAGAPGSSDDEGHTADTTPDSTGNGSGEGDNRQTNENTGCPQCPFLVSKRCACGKKMVDNVQCFSAPEKVRCGEVCGKLMACGFHHCERPCHADPCGDCNALCGKDRKSCLPERHPCSHHCHAPAACSEADPCQAVVTLICPCGRLKQTAQCGRRIPQGATAPIKVNHSAQPKCNSDCEIAKRNARLAEALGISSSGRAPGGEVVYSDELVGFARVNAKFLVLVEKTFAEFIQSEKKSQVLPHMPPERRKFVHDLAKVYRIDTQMVDQEPNRSVQLLRRVDTRMPSPLLSAHIASSGLKPVSPAPTLGRLADMSLRGGGSSWRSSAVSTRVNTPLTTAAGSTGSSDSVIKSKGWTSVVAPSRSANASPAPAGSSNKAGTSVSGSTPILSHNVGTSVRTPSRGASPLPSTSVSHSAASDAQHEQNSETAVPQNWEDEDS